VAGEADDLEARVAAREVGEEVVAPVGAAVVDEDRLGRPVELVEHRAQAPLELRQRLLLVADRDDERVARGVHGTGVDGRGRGYRQPAARGATRSDESGPGHSSRTTIGPVCRTTLRRPKATGFASSACPATGR